ncbi:surface protein D [Babesia divergens]|uniref:Surface protein D n=1 Tax=Babesia divergens TaxID=32595 RepID=A0AAD9GF75_BABDI|nr:surface protein D [Babesia divergens]
MAVKGGFIAMLFFLTAFFARARADGACKDADLATLGFNAGTPDDAQIAKLALSTSALRKVGKNSLSLTAAKDLDKIQTKLEKEFAKAGLTGVNSACVRCFAESTQCVAKHCKSQCLNEFSNKCTKCIKEHCHNGFSKCVGMPTIDPAEHQDKIKNATQ